MTSATGRGCRARLSPTRTRRLSWVQRGGNESASATVGGPRGIERNIRTGPLANLLVSKRIGRDWRCLWAVRSAR